MGMLTLCFVLPRLVSSGLPIANGIAALLGVVAFFTGMAIGTLLPVPMPGACLGVTLSVLIVGVLPEAERSTQLYFNLLCPTLAIALALVRYRSAILVAATTFVAGGVASFLVMPDVFGNYLSSVVSGTPIDVKLIGWWTDKSFYVWLLLSSLTYCVIYLMNAKTNNHWTRLKNWWKGDRYVPYNPIPDRTANKSAQQPSFDGDDSPPATEVYNMFDPSDLPPRLDEYKDMAYISCEDLGNFFGFQDSSVRNQAEHVLCLLANHRRYNGGARPIPPMVSLHNKIFDNYRKWCKHVGARPIFSSMAGRPDQNEAVSRARTPQNMIFDLVLYFCIWGEGGNLRHMPELTWFLFHKMME
eukprot:CAMPEP_0194305466 /NCGR_PEP_ID=MMETSP0171-20130528/2898_1 /TAXON_ID=218684 /ORGANISM="Corethron pennatum, Strain L29A3" /LENGTH=355 /DNA_ID=CAMNT_0039057007 /DNA_START=382 /DNA_END=1446 /DNA_ORIENTATION=+